MILTDSSGGSERLSVPLPFYDTGNAIDAPVNGIKGFELIGLNMVISIGKAQTWAYLIT